MKEFFSIEDVAMMTNLSTRTIRNYIADGFLTGDKSSGAWQFTAEQLDAFFQEKAVQPTLHAKKNAIVYDFITNKPKGQGKMCVILDLSLLAAERATMLFCSYMSEVEPKAELNFASDRFGSGARLILSGSDADVTALLNRYYAER